MILLSEQFYQGNRGDNSRDALLGAPNGFEPAQARDQNSRYRRRLPEANSRSNFELFFRASIGRGFTRGS